MLEILALIVFYIIVALFCWMMSGSIPDIWQQLTAIGVDNKLSLEVTGIEVDDYSVAVTMVVTNDDSRSHTVCVGGRGYLKGEDTPTREPGARYYFFNASNDPDCVEVAEHSSQTVLHRLTPIYTGVTRDGYKNFEVCGDIYQVDDVETFRWGRAWGVNIHKHCALFSGP